MASLTQPRSFLLLAFRELSAREMPTRPQSRTRGEPVLWRTKWSVLEQAACVKIGASRKDLVVLSVALNNTCIPHVFSHF